MAGQIIGDNTTSGFAGAAFNLTSPKQFEGGIHEVILNTNQRLIEFGVLWLPTPANGTTGVRTISVCLYNLADETMIPGTATTITYDTAALVAGGVATHVKQTGLSINLTAHAGKRIGLGLAPPNTGSSSGFTVGIRTLSGSIRNNHNTNTATLPATFVVASNAPATSWGIYAVTEDIPGGAQSVTSINGGSAITAGQTGVAAVLSGFTGLPSITTNTAGVNVGSITGSASAPVFNVSDRIEGGLYPSLPATVQFTFTNGSETASDNQSVTFKSGESKVTLSSPVTNDSTYVGALFVEDGHTASGADFYYTAFGDLSISSTGQISTTNAGTFTGWLRPSAGSTAGRMYEYSITVTEDGAVVSVERGLTAVGLSSTGITASGLVAVGL